MILLGILRRLLLKGLMLVIELVSGYNFIVYSDEVCLVWVVL